MKATLMHRDIPVVDMTIDAATSAIVWLGMPYAREHLPVGIHDRASLNNWWITRAIPASRQGLTEVLETLNMTSPSELLLRSYGLSLSDQYWVCPKSSSFTWDNVNFFDNAFSEDVGRLLFDRVDSKLPHNLVSPDNTSDGWLRKKWVIIDGVRCLLKGGSGADQQEPYNEAFASELMKRLQIPHAEYHIEIKNGSPVSVCPDFITRDTELVTAWYLKETLKRPNDVSAHQHYLNACQALGIPNVQIGIDQMITVDYILMNQDRHYNNFGAVRDARTLEWLGPAPIYDSGTSLFLDKHIEAISATADVSCRPFKKTHEKQLELVSSFDWLDFSSLKGIEEAFWELTKNSPTMHTDRREAICKAIQDRITMLYEYASQRSVFYTTNTSMEDDVQDNIAYSGDFEQSALVSEQDDETFNVEAEKDEEDLDL